MDLKMNLIRKTGLQQFGLGIAMVGLTLLSSCTYDHVQPDVCFQSEVLPIFVTYCSTTGCHNAIDREEGYDLTNYDGIMRGVTPKSIIGSRVVTSMTGSGEEQMPPSGYPQPSPEQIATVKAWVKSGAANTSNCATASCDTAAAVTYSGDVAPLMQTYCNGCHGGGSPSAGLNFTDYTSVKNNAISGRIQGSMTADPNYKVMPPGGNLVSSCYVDKISKWVAAGAPNN